MLAFAKKVLVQSWCDRFTVTQSPCFTCYLSSHLLLVFSPATCLLTCYLSSHLLLVFSPATCLLTCYLSSHLLIVFSPANCLLTCYLSSHLLLVFSPAPCFTCYLSSHLLLVFSSNLCSLLTFNLCLRVCVGLTRTVHVHTVSYLYFII